MDQPTSTEPGYCQCGCGERTTLVRNTSHTRGERKGDHCRFVRGHHSRRRGPEYVVVDGGCWEWAGRRDDRGYGQLGIQGRSFRAHRVFFERFKGPIPEGLCVLHHCDNPPCVNPDHLYAGTQLDNARDRISRKRNAVQSRSANSNAKLTERQVCEIRSRFTGSWGEKSRLAREYGVGFTAIADIIAGRSWA